MLSAAAAWADEEAPQQDPGDEKAATDPYQGVTLSGGEPPPTEPPPPGFQNVTWTGFRVTDESTEVFLQLTGPVTYKEKVKGTRILVTVDKVKIPRRNNLRPVITEHFKRSAVTRFRLKPQRRGKATLDIRLRQRATPSVGLKTHGTFTYLVVTLPTAAPPEQP